MKLRLQCSLSPVLPADTPMNTFAPAFGAFSLLTDAAATVKAIDTYTG